MSKREKILATVVALAAVAFGGDKFLLPAISKHVFAVAKENDRLREKLADLDARLGEVEPFRTVYRDLLARTGTTDAEKIQNDLFARLTDMVGEAGLSNPRVSPRKTTDYRPGGRKLKKAGIRLVRYSVTAEGKLDAIVGFLRSFYEMPYIAQITSLKLDPPSSRLRKKGGLVKMTAAIEAMVPPAHPVSEVNVELLQQPVQHVKHSQRDYQLIASREPFTGFAPPPPTRPTRPKTPVKKVVEKPKEPDEPLPPPPPAGDPNREQKVIRMVLMYGVDEVLVVNTRDRSSEYVGIGEKLDGGDVLFIHPLGTAARREDGSTRIYPVGKRLSECLPLEDARRGYPEIVYAYDELKDSFEPAGDNENKDEAANGTTQPAKGTGIAGEAKDANAATEKKDDAKEGEKESADSAVKKASDEGNRGDRTTKSGHDKPATGQPANANKKTGSDKPEPKQNGTSQAEGKESGEGQKDTKKAADSKPDEADESDETKEANESDDDES
ncbi:MAG: hypothetical protein V3W34_12990 [Phycisphaerae bacterium]